jgi:hypothetical protein
MTVLYTIEINKLEVIKIKIEMIKIEESGIILEINI